MRLSRNCRPCRGERLAAVRSGLRIKSALDRVVALDPDLHDAYFGIGMYHYWADVAPLGAKLLRLLLLLPGGDRKQGLQEMLDARAKGVLLSGEADFQLHWLYLWFEEKPAEALTLVQSLDARYPSNPIFLQRIAEIEHEYRHDHRASAAAWQQLLERAQHRSSGGGLARRDARAARSRRRTGSSSPSRSARSRRSTSSSRPAQRRRTAHQQLRS